MIAVGTRAGLLGFLGDRATLMKQPRASNAQIRSGFVMKRRDLFRAFGFWVAYASTRPAVNAESLGVAAAGSTFAVASDSRPWTYAFWLDGNVTKEGITADLEAMRAAGIGGLLFMDGSLEMPRGAYRFMSGPWQEQFRHMAAEAHRLGLSINVNNGAGWSGSGGPWVSTEDASQKVIHHELTLDGPVRWEAALPRPAGIRHGHYRDIALLAYRIGDRAPDLCIADFNSTKTFGGAKDSEQVVPWPRFVPTDVRWPTVAAHECLVESTMLDLTAQLDEDRVKWQVPPGRWLVLRLGHTVSNGVTRMSQPEATGLETDKLSRGATQRHFAAYVAKLALLGGNAIVAAHIDSWEAGSGNWTPGLRDEFKHRRGYDPQPYLPTLAGFVVGSRERSERFLWDFRETIAELLLQNYADEMRKLANAAGMRLSIEGYDAPCDDLRRSPEEILRRNHVPPDFECSPNLNGLVNYIHRRNNDGSDVYFIVNKSDMAVEGMLKLRSRARRPQLLATNWRERAPGILFLNPAV
jgi:hypothetical protein